ncbi:MAG: class I SAM-dependent methyltransferase [Coraliomargarita sp.]
MRPQADCWKVLALDPAQADAANRWASRLGGEAIACPPGLSGTRPKALDAFLREATGASSGQVFLCEADGLSLHFFGQSSMRLRADFHGPEVSYRRRRGGGRGQMIARAVGLKSGGKPDVLDATAGLGADAFVLACLGCQVRLLERSPALCALVESAMETARSEADAELHAILGRMQLKQADALDALPAVPPEARPEVVYLDPMFPPRSKSALVKKEMRLVHQLVGEDPDSGALLEAALPVASGRVVVKRPRVAPDLGGRAPDYRLEGKSNRYDVYLATGQGNARDV